MKKAISYVKFIGYALYLIIPALLISEVFLYQVEKQHVAIALTNLDAQAAIQKARIEDMIEGYYQRILSITSREVLRRSLVDFWEYGDIAQLVVMKKFLPNVKQPFSDFKEIFIFDREGNAVTSTEESIKMGVIPVNQHVLSEGQQRLTVTFFEPTASSESESKSKSRLMKLLLMGPIFFNGERIGGVAIVANNTTLARIAGDYSGLGETGETRIAKKNQRGDAEVIVGSRFSDHPQAMANIPQHQLDNPMTQALFRYEGLLTNTVNYRGHTVFAATRFIPEEEWGITVEMDKKEVLKPVMELRRLAYSLLGIVFMFWLTTGFLWIK